MTARRVSSRAPVPVVQTPKVANADTQRALDTLAAAVQQLQAKRGVAAASVTGSRGSGAALESLLAALADLGIIRDDTEA